MLCDVAEAANTPRKGDRYGVTFTPVGWQVIDTEVARDPIHEFGTGPDEYKRAKAAADKLNFPHERDYIR